jgi:hypothetical protein
MPKTAPPDNRSIFTFRKLSLLDTVLGLVIDLVMDLALLLFTAFTL